MAVSEASVTRKSPPSGGPPVSPLAVPPAWLPLAWLACAVVGLIGFGTTLAITANTIVHAPGAPTAVATVHIAMLAFLSTAVLGASHQFGPVVAGRRLRSVTAGLITLALWVPASWLLPFAFATHRPVLLEIAGVLAFSAVCLAAWNLSGPLLRRGRGTPVLGLRMAIVFLVLTAAFGATYAFDLHHGFFLLLPRRVLAHAHLGLIGWIGLAYVAVAEKLWPMFLLAHRPSTAAGDWAVRLVAGGVPVVAIGLLIPSVPLTSIGAGIVVAGLTAHLVSLAGVIRHRRRRMELLHAYVLTSAVMLIVAVWAAAIAGMFETSTAVRTRAVQTEIFALTMWLALAIVGHLHKIVPFISWSRMRKAGHTKAPNGRPLLFAHLVNAPAARTAYITGVIAAVSGTAGLAGSHVFLVEICGVALAITGLVVLVNLTSGPLRIIAIDKRAATESESESDSDATTETPTPVAVS
ncbi:MAG TPA: hypothetical protein VFN21_10835 [Acidimicrobiales bacterium]|nr:hypothetical protein [Acidimicrobiales bacterium]